MGMYLVKSGEDDFFTLFLMKADGRAEVEGKLLAWLQDHYTDWYAEQVMRDAVVFPIDFQDEIKQVYPLREA